MFYIKLFLLKLYCTLSPSVAVKYLNKVHFNIHTQHINGRVRYHFLFPCTNLCQFLKHDTLFFPSIEPPLSFSLPLKDTSLIKNEGVTLTCEVTKPGQKVRWFKNGKPLKTDAKKGIKITSKDNSHILSIAKCSKDDAGEYTAQVGSETTTGNLFVDGKLTASWKCRIEQEALYLFCICL